MMVFSSTRASIESGSTIQHQLIRHQLESVPGQRPFLREAVLVDRPGQVPVSEHAVLELIADRLALVQCHGHHSSAELRDGCSGDAGPNWTTPSSLDWGDEVRPGRRCNGAYGQAERG